MAINLRDDIVAIRRRLIAGGSSVDGLVERIVRKLSICETSELLIGRGDDRAEQTVVAGWIAGRLAAACGERTVVARTEIVAAMVATIGKTPEDAAALACRLRTWPSSLIRLVHTSRERINGLGEPFGHREDRLSRSSQRVAIAFESAARLTAANGRAGEVIETLLDETNQNFWRKGLVDDASNVLVELGEAYRERRLAPVRARTFRVSSAHQVRAPHMLERTKKRQRIARRHVSHGPISNRRPASVRIRQKSDVRSSTTPAVAVNR